MDTLLTLRRRHLLGLAGAMGTLALAGCHDTRSAGAPARPAQGFSGQTMGSSYTVRLAGAALSQAGLQSLQADVQSALDAVDQRMSLYRAGSELVRFNQAAAGQPLPLSQPLLQVLQAAQQVSTLSGGAFDVTVAPLVMAWGFGPEAPPGGPAVPSAAQLQAGRRVLGHHALQLDVPQARAIKHVAGLQADLGGIAKGYGVDMAAQVLQAQGVQRFMLEVGGEVRTAGLNAQGRPWQIGIEEPDAVPQRARLVVPLSGQAMATSGDYRIYFEHAGRRYSHEIDPRSGEPVAHGLASVTVLARDCMQADALATALFVLGPDAGLALAQREHLAAHFILRAPDGRLQDRSTDAFAALRNPAAA
jgi:thiamine biosynthesis lipoprotein